jgi:hypothetical protein
MTAGINVPIGLCGFAMAFDDDGRSARGSLPYPLASVTLSSAGSVARPRGWIRPAASRRAAIVRFFGPQVERADRGTKRTPYHWFSSMRCWRRGTNEAYVERRAASRG